MTRSLPLRTALLLAALAACADSESRVPTDPSAGDTAWVEIGYERFELELALDRPSRHRGLSFRPVVAPTGGMLFVFPESRPLRFLMRDCAIPLDLAFLDETGRILAIHEMQPEAPRRPGEDLASYERRLRQYTSPGPARFAIETAGGRLAGVGARVGDRVVFDAETLAQRAR